MSKEAKLLIFFLKASGQNKLIDLYKWYAKRKSKLPIDRHKSYRYTNVDWTDWEHIPPVEKVKRLLANHPLEINLSKHLDKERLDLSGKFNKRIFSKMLEALDVDAQLLMGMSIPMASTWTFFSNLLSNKETTISSYLENNKMLDFEVPIKRLIEPEPRDVGLSERRIKKFLFYLAHGHMETFLIYVDIALSIDPKALFIKKLDKDFKPNDKLFYAALRVNPKFIKTFPGLINLCSIDLKDRLAFKALSLALESKKSDNLKIQDLLAVRRALFFIHAKDPFVLNNKSLLNRDLLRFFIERKICSSSYKIKSLEKERAKIKKLQY